MSAFKDLKNAISWRWSVWFVLIPTEQYLQPQTAHGQPNHSPRDQYPLQNKSIPRPHPQLANIRPPSKQPFLPLFNPRTGSGC